MCTININAKVYKFLDELVHTNLKFSVCDETDKFKVIDSLLEDLAVQFVSQIYKYNNITCMFLHKPLTVEPEVYFQDTTESRQALKSIIRNVTCIGTIYNYLVIEIIQAFVDHPDIICDNNDTDKCSSVSAKFKKHNITLSGHNQIIVGALEKNIPLFQNFTIPKQFINAEAELFYMRYLLNAVEHYTKYYINCASKEFKMQKKLYSLEMKETAYAAKGELLPAEDQSMLEKLTALSGLPFEQRVFTNDTFEDIDKMIGNKKIMLPIIEYYANLALAQYKTSKKHCIISPMRSLQIA